MQNMKLNKSLGITVLAILFAAVSAQNMLTCRNRWSPCYRRVIRCPQSCPYTKPSHPNAKACYLDCNSPTCEAVCRGRKANCNGVGSGCYDPRFIGSDGTVFYFHGKKDETFSLVSDPNLQINARFKGISRTRTRKRDFTWIEALGIMYGPNIFTIEAKSAEKWDDSIDHFEFYFNKEKIHVPEGHLSEWKSSITDEQLLKVERTGSRNSVRITVDEIAELAINVVPVTKEDDKVHKYGIPDNDCFAHLEVQFNFLMKLSPQVEGVLGRTYRPDFENPAKRGVDMPVLGGEDEYRTSSISSSDCKMCLFHSSANCPCKKEGVHRHLGLTSRENTALGLTSSQSLPVADELTVITLLVVVLSNGNGLG